jgi:hypothetical protein
VIALQEYVRDQVFLTRNKDYENPIRRSTFRNEAEMRAVVGTPGDNPFVKIVREKTERFREAVAEIKKRG